MKKSRTLHHKHNPSKKAKTTSTAQNTVVTVASEDSPERWLWLGPTLVFSVLLFFYMATMPSVVTFEDSGFFILNCYNGSIAHPPGYPLYSMLCYPFSHLPFASAAVNLNILSALFAALACALLYNIVVNWLKSPICAYIAALAWGFCDVMWSQAIIQEVYSLNALLFMVLLKLSLMVSHEVRPRTLIGLVLAYGLALSNHWPLIVLSSPVLLLLLLQNTRQIANHCRKPRLAFSLLGALGLGLSPYVYLVFRGNSSPFVEQYGAMDSLAKIFHYIGRYGYAGIDQQSVGLDNKLAYMQFLLNDAVNQYGWGALVVIVLGAICQWRWLGKRISAAMLLMYVATSWVLVVGLLNFEYNALMVHVVSAYTGIAYAVFAVWAAVGVRAVCDKARALLPSPVPPPLATVSAYMILLGVVGSIVAANYTENDRHDDTAAYDFAHKVLSSLDKNATLLIDSDDHFPIRALNQVQGLRRDITLYNIQGLLEANNYDSPWTNTRQQRNRIRAVIRHAAGPVYYFSPFNHSYGVDDFGLYKQIKKQRLADSIDFVLEPSVLDYMANLKPRAHEHLWNNSHLRKVKGHLARLLIEFDHDSQATKPWLDKLLQNGYYGSLAYATLWLSEYYQELLVPRGRIQSERLLEILKSSHKRMDNSSNIEQAQFHYLKGMVLYAHAQRDQALRIDTDIDSTDYLSDLVTASEDAENDWLRSLELHPTVNNPAWSLLFHLYTQLQQQDKLDALQARYPGELDNSQ